MRLDGGLARLHVMDAMPTEYGAQPSWEPEAPHFSVVRLLGTLLVMTPALLIAAAIVPGVSIPSFWGALVVALFVVVVNFFVPPIIAAIRLPLTLVVDFLLILVIDALVFQVASNLDSSAIHVDGFGAALLMALVTSAVAVVLEVLLGADDDDTYSLRVINRIARRSGERVESREPGIVFLEIDGLAYPVLQRAMRDGNAPNMARWMSDGHRIVEWEPDLSSQTGASQAGILLGSNEDIPAFRWVEKETGTLMTCSAPPDCAEIERRHATGIGLLRNGGASRGNLLSGEADHVILTVSRIEAEKQSNPGYRAFFANGYNVTRTLVLFGWEVILELVAAARSKRRDIQPRGHRGFVYALMRGAMCVAVRDLIVYGVLTDMMKGRPAVYATFSSYDEVAHHSGLERQDTLEALRKLDGQFGRIDRARRYAPRPYVIVVLSDHGQTQGATFKQRNGYGLEDLVRKSLAAGDVTAIGGGDESQANLGNAVGEARGKQPKKKKNDVSRRGRRRPRLREPRADLPDGRAAPADRRGDRRAPPGAAARAAQPPARRLAAGALERARGGRARRQRDALPRERPRRGRGPAGRVLAAGGAAPAAHGRLRARRRHHGRQLLRPGPGAGLRVRGADLVPRRPRRPADAAVRPGAGGRCRCPTSRSSARPRCTDCCWAGGSTSPARRQSRPQPPRN